MTTPPVALTIAGSDSGGGAGVQTDLVTFAAHGVHGASVITALTAQNTVGVDGVHVPPVEFLRAQLEAVLGDLPVAAVKTGMLATEEVVRAVGDVAAAGRLPHLVVDPVLVSSTGARLLDEGAERAYVDALFPHALVVTPNTREASALVGGTVATAADARRGGGRDRPARAAVGGDQGRPPGRRGRWRGQRGCRRRGRRDRHRGGDRAAGPAGRHPQRPRHRLHLRGRHRGPPRTRVSRCPRPWPAPRRSSTPGLVASAGWHLGAGHGPVGKLAAWRPPVG